MTDISPIGLLGGVFDPVHYGHLHIAKTLLMQLGWHRIHFIPCKQQVLKQTADASPAQRLMMLQLALENTTEFVIDTRELERTTPSYTIDTLEALRIEFPKVSLCWILGMDAFSSLPRWHRWQDLLTLAHLVIVNRPGISLPETDLLTHFLNEFRTSDSQLLKQKTCGHIFLQPIEPLAISSTEIRQRIQKKQSVADLLPKAVWRFIENNRLYCH